MWYTGLWSHVCEQKPKSRQYGEVIRRLVGLIDYTCQSPVTGRDKKHLISIIYYHPQLTYIWLQSKYVDCEAYAREAYITISSKILLFYTKFMFLQTLTIFFLLDQTFFFLNHHTIH